MANCNDLFHTYNGNLRLNKSKRDRMISSRESSREKIQKHFEEHHPGYDPDFWLQGSWKMKLTIRTEDDGCDQDDGIYFKRDPDNSVSGTTLQKWVYDAVKDDTTQGAEHRKKCVRKKYKENNMGTYHIDYPIYYFTDDMDHPMLAVKNDELEESDPKEFYEWFNQQKDANGQLLRIIRFLKGWCSYKGKIHKMLSGLCMTVLAVDNLSRITDRDDKALYYTLCNIQTALEAKWECMMPTTPEDNLFAKYNDTLKRNFMNALDEFIKDAKDALLEKSKSKAAELWKKHLGSRFPEFQDTEEKNGSTRGNRAALAAVVGNNKPWFDGSK